MSTDKNINARQTYKKDIPKIPHKENNYEEKNKKTADALYCCRVVSLYDHKLNSVDYSSTERYG